ncbi:uncharacterized protein B0H64DRAFT_321475 [Chaetomium fimeti]|uniref:Uncharacterized protein n=1 Tax=Chaetomium fimeti TaxID=1854472 RepID=A0AAE0HFF9_9PEZI|nr:hypothetical protein B0H64DRAFT_321475 [Chaetomium fimeti]
MHGLPMANWQPPPAHFQGSPSGVAFQGLPHIETASHAYPHRLQTPQPARVTHGLPTWDANQQTAHAHPLRRRVSSDNVVAASRGYDNGPDLTRRLEDMEERSEEEQKQRLRLESKMDENAQTLANILKELKALKPQTVVPTNSVAVPVANSNNEIPAVSIASNAPHNTNSVTQQHPVNRSLTMGDNIEAHQQTGQVQNDTTEEANSTAGGMVVRVSKRQAQPEQTGDQAGESLKRAKTAHATAADTSKSDSGSSRSSSVGARSTAVFQLLPEVAQEHLQQQQPGDRAEESSASKPSTPPIEATAPGPSNNSNNDPDLRWAREFLDFIKRMDCTSDKDLLTLKTRVKGRASFDFPLCTDSPTRRSKLSYFLKIGGSLSTTLTPNPDNRPTQPGAAREAVEHLNIYETYHGRRCAAASGSEFRAYHPPRYVVPLGEVYRACRSSDKPGEVVSTNFLAFMDVGTPRKSVWLMYRYERAVEDRDRVQWQPVATHGERDSVFSSAVRTFDAVCLLEDVEGWKGPAEDMVGMRRFEEALPESGHMVLNCVFYTPVLERLREAIKKGWEPAVENDEEEE